MPSQSGPAVAFVTRATPPVLDGRPVGAGRVEGCLDGLVRELRGRYVFAVETAGRSSPGADPDQCDRGEDQHDENTGYELAGPPNIADRERRDRKRPACLLRAHAGGAPIAARVARESSAANTWAR